MARLALFLVLLGPALFLVLSPMSDCWSLLTILLKRRRRETPVYARQPTLQFLVPAHDEMLLIGDCVKSLRDQDYPQERLIVTVVADNCSDDTSVVASRAGARVMVREEPGRPGKGQAIGWALGQLNADTFDALVIVDADTVVDRDFARQLAQYSPLDSLVLQCYDTSRNEFESWLTVLSGLLTRNRYDLALPLKEKAGLNVPLTGDGVVLGRDVLKKHHWSTSTITEGWELYAQLTASGERIRLASAARVYAQEAKSLRQARSQRARWTAGRIAVFTRTWHPIRISAHISHHQRLDLTAELLSQGPTLHGTLAALGAVACVYLRPWGATVLGLLYAAALAQPLAYSIVSLAHHPHPWRILRASLWLPVYIGWRAALAAMILFKVRPGRASGSWVRTTRHASPGR